MNKDEMQGKIIEKQKNSSKFPSDSGLCKLKEPCPSRKSFIIVALAILFLLMGATIPTPLYQLYRFEFALSPIAITLIYAIYAIGVIPTLFFFGPLGDSLGRKPLLIIAISFGVMGTVILGFAQGFNWLLIGRFVQGIGIGAVLGNATAALVEFEPNENKQRASQIAAMTQLGGLGLGTLTAGLMAEYLFAPTLLVYILEFILLIIILVLIFTIKGTDNKSETFHIRKPALPKLKGLFATSSLASSIALAMSGLYFSLAPTYVQNILHVNNVALGGIIASIMVFTSVIVERILWERFPVFLEVGGLIFIIFGLSLISAASIYSSVSIFIVAAIISGIGFGCTFMGAINVINKIAPPDQRGDVTSSFYAISYIGLGIPIIGLGFAAQSLNIQYAVVEFIIVLIIIALIDIPLILLKRHDL